MKLAPIGTVNYHQGMVARMEQIPDELIRQLDSQIDAQVELNRQANNLVLLGKKELITSLVQDENNQPYPHFGAYRKTFALPLQEQLFSNCLDLMRTVEQIIIITTHCLQN